MKKTLHKSAFRAIRSGLSRFLAIFAIVALGVGFFAGLKTCKPAMLRTAEDYLGRTNFQDFRLLSSLGFTEEEIDALGALPGISAAEGGVFADFIAKTAIKEGEVLAARSLTDRVDTLSLTAGRLPEKADECVLDARYFKEEMLGTTLSLSDSNSEETFAAFTSHTFTVVGLANSPIYLNYERGSTSLAAGAVAAFVYLPREAFTAEYAYEAVLTLAETYPLYSEDYRKAVKDLSPSLEEKASSLIQARFDSEIAKAKAELDETGARLTAEEARLADAEKTLTEQAAALEAAAPFLSPEEYAAQKEALRQAEETLNEGKKTLAEGRAAWQAGLDELTSTPAPTLHLLTREENVGYVCFENDASIVEGIAAVFPVFFFLIAALVCLTTMTRMVAEERGEIGTLKSIGYSNFAVMRKYLLYSGLAALGGCLAGFFVGSLAIPKVIWMVYRILYGFAPLISVIQPALGLLCLAVAALCSLGATYAAARHELTHAPASLMRPKAPKSGKRIFLENFPLWRKLSFLRKISIRNLFRYKKRVFMMIFGIGGCTALLLTGFGVRDSITGIVPRQFDEISVYDYSITFRDTMDDAAREAFRNDYQDKTATIAFFHDSVQSVSAAAGTNAKSAHIVTSSGENFEHFITLRQNGKPIALPGKGEAVISDGLAEKLSLKVGDSLKILYNNEISFEVTVSGLAENYVYYYVYLQEDTLREAVGDFPIKSAYIEEAGEKGLLGPKLSEDERVANTTSSESLKDRIISMLDSLDAIVWLVIVCAGVLAFIVLYNLTNINITEREREIATLKVLGFYPGETSRYVFRENYILTFFGALVGLVAGKFLHLFVMKQIKIDLMTFDIRIAPLSLLFSLVLTFLFALLVSFAMRRRLAAIDMTTSLKSVE